MFSSTHAFLTWTTNRIKVNHLGTAMLAVLLLPYLMKTANVTSKEENPTLPRIVVVSSGVHFWVKITDEERESPNILAKLNDPRYCADHR